MKRSQNIVSYQRLPSLTFQRKWGSTAYFALELLLAISLWYSLFGGIFYLTTVVNWLVRFVACDLFKIGTARKTCEHKKTQQMNVTQAPIIYSPPFANKTLDCSDTLRSILLRIFSNHFKVCYCSNEDVHWLYIIIVQTKTTKTHKYTSKHKFPSHLQFLGIWESCWSVY